MKVTIREVGKPQYQEASNVMVNTKGKKPGYKRTFFQARHTVPLQATTSTKQKIILHLDIKILMNWERVTESRRIKFTSQHYYNLYKALPGLEIEIEDSKKDFIIKESSYNNIRSYL